MRIQHLRLVEKNHQKIRLPADFGDPTKAGSDPAYHLLLSITHSSLNIKRRIQSVEVTGFAPAESWMVSRIPHFGTPTQGGNITKKCSLVQRLNSLSRFSLVLPGGYTIADPQNKFTKLGEVVSGFLNLAFLGAGFLMLSWFTWGAFQYLYAGGNKEALAKARARLIWAIAGFLIVVISFSISKYGSEFFAPQNVQITPVSPP